MKLALIGKNISHSQSERIYKEKHDRDIRYTLINIEDESKLPSLESLFQEYDGVSITSPYKSSYFSSLETNDELKDLRIVNTIKHSHGKYLGVLTDLLAFREIFSQLYDNKSPISILGDGAMGRMVSMELSNNSIEHQVFSRRLNNIEYVPSKSSFIINTCSRDYIFHQEIDSKSLFWDFNYDFKPHKWLGDKCRYVDGTELLEKQAEHALKFWLST